MLVRFPYKRKMKITGDRIGERDLGFHRSDHSLEDGMIFPHKHALIYRIGTASGANMLANISLEVTG